MVRFLILFHNTLSLLFFSGTPFLRIYGHSEAVVRGEYHIRISLYVIATRASGIST